MIWTLNSKVNFWKLSFWIVHSRLHTRSPCFWLWSPRSLNLNTFNKLQDCHSQNTRWFRPYLYFRISANSLGLVKIVQESLFKISQKIVKNVKICLKIYIDADRIECSLYSALTLSASAVSHCIRTMMWSEGWSRVVLSGTPRTTRSCKIHRYTGHTKI